MVSDLHRTATIGLEQSCELPPGDWMRLAPSLPGLERMEASFARHAFDPHRHDTYALGFTLQGVQSFRYEGTARISLAGQVFVLHPDELHDGHAGTEDGFRYRILYLEPKLLRAVLGDNHPLPFLRGAVTQDRRLTLAIAAVLEDLESPLEELQCNQLLVDLAEALVANDSSAMPVRISARHLHAAEIARDLLDAKPETRVSSAEIEAASGLSRYELARQFRACFGTSPYRYLIQRRLDRARELIRQGTALADAAAAAGFADQSHMTRQFKKTYGIAPGRWAAMTALRAATS